MYSRYCVHILVLYMYCSRLIRMKDQDVYVQHVLCTPLVLYMNYSRPMGLKDQYMYSTDTVRELTMANGSSEIGNRVFDLDQLDE
jgi:hypothetical protein